MIGLDRRGVWVVVAVSAFTAGACGETSAPLFSSRAVESMVIVRDPESGGAMTRQVAVDHHQLFETAPGRRDVVVRETITSGYLEGTDGGEGAEAQVELFFRREDGAYPRMPDHVTTVAEVSRLAFQFDHWTATVVGCCDAQPILQLFGYGEGTPFLFSNVPYAQVILPNANVTRYAGAVMRTQLYLDDLARAVFGDDEQAVAAVYYGGPGKTLEKQLIYPVPDADDGDLPYHVESVALKSASAKDEDGYNENAQIGQVLNLWSQDTMSDEAAPTHISGVEIIATFMSGEGTTHTVTIPVSKDRFEKARLTGGKLTVKPTP